MGEIALARGDNRVCGDGGLSSEEAAARLRRHGRNALPVAKTPSLFATFLKQFLNPLIYVLLIAAIVSWVISDAGDALFIAGVLLLNGVIGATQEHSANRAAEALRRMEQSKALVIRDGRQQQIAAEELVPGDLVLLEAGERVQADLKIAEAVDLQCDESLLTGESLPVKKRPAASEQDTGRETALFGGTVVTRGRARGIVAATGKATEIGRIAVLVGKRAISQPPLMIRMERFSKMIALAVGVAIVCLAMAGLARDMTLHELFMLSVGLAVSAIPEGLPVAVSVALAIGMRRMARANVIVRKMPAVESLGSCTMIATDKTGTLTLNQLTVVAIVLPNGQCLSPGDAGESEVAALLRAAVLPNEAQIHDGPEGSNGVGDMVDIALLQAARRSALAHQDIRDRHPLIQRIPYEPDLKFAASFHRTQEDVLAFVKGAPETVLAMAERMLIDGRAERIDRRKLLEQARSLAEQGLRVLAFAEGNVAEAGDDEYETAHLSGLTFLGLVGMQDPIRPEVPAAIRRCYEAGIQVAMITGDDPRTAGTIARQAGIAFTDRQVVTGTQVREAESNGGEAGLDALTKDARIFARVEPTQKLAIVLSMSRNGHFVAVTGDGVNDAPALKHAHVGVAMGRKGTEVAKESAHLIITDDNFASIVNGIREGRVAYANIRKVILMVISTGAAEVLLFLLAIPLGLPMPLLPVQLLWLNVVTNGIQDIGLAAEHAEGDELSRPPRRPSEPIFDAVMIRRVLVGTLIMGGGGFLAFYWMIAHGYGEAQARNLLLLLFVMFENVQTISSRSEHHSALRQGFLANPFLILGIVLAQAIHIAAMHLPGLSAVLSLEPVSFPEWGGLLGIALVALLLTELDKWRLRARRTAPLAAGGLPH